MKATLVLQNGLVMQGVSVGAAGTALGEVIFTTGMAGFEETLTDPGYAGQIVAQTYPMVGNYGITREDMVSDRIWAKGYIVREACEVPSNFRCKTTLDAFLKEQNVVGIQGIDTRRLTRVLRDEGTMNGAITTEYDSMSDEAKQKLLADIAAYSAKEAALAAVPTQTRVLNESGAPHVAMLDFGCQNGIADALAQRGCKVTVLPGVSGIAQLAGMNYDGLVVGDGAGDPAWQPVDPAALRTVLESGKPFIGIGLGHELAALAFGAKLIKMQHGHHGANKPVTATESGKIYTTNQNCGFMVDAASLPADAKVAFKDTKDGSCAGVEYAHGFTVQFQPRMDGGSRGTDHLYDEFIAKIKGVH